MYINPNRAVYTNIYVPDLNHDDNNFKYLYPPPNQKRASLGFFFYCANAVSSLNRGNRGRMR